MEAATQDSTEAAGFIVVDWEVVVGLEVVVDWEVVVDLEVVVDWELD